MNISGKNSIQSKVLIQSDFLLNLKDIYTEMARPN